MSRRRTTRSYKHVRAVGIKPVKLAKLCKLDGTSIPVISVRMEMTGRKEGRFHGTWPE